MLENKIYDLDELDDLLEGLSDDALGQAVGLKVAYPVGGDYEILQTARVGDCMIGLELLQACMKCGGQPEKFYLCKGVQGWRYLFLEDGTFVADMCNTGYLCDMCIKQAQQRSFLILVLPPEREDRGDPSLHRPPAGLGRERLN